MARFLVEGGADESDGREELGWFDPDSATKFSPRGQAESSSSILYHTEGGAWVLERTRNGEPTRRFLSNIYACEWLAHNGHEEAADRLFEGPAERSPGRRDVVQVELGEQILRERYAHGEIDDDEYRRRLQILRSTERDGSEGDL